MVLLRNEHPNNYNLEVWLDYWKSEGYNFTQIIEMLEVGKGMPKYGGNVLGMGDLITAWKKTKEELYNVSFRAFMRMFQDMAKRNFKLLNDIAIELTGTDYVKNPDAKKFREFLDKQIQAIEDERLAVEYENAKKRNAGIAGIMDRIKVDKELQDKANKYILECELKELEELADFLNRECKLKKILIPADPEKGKKEESITIFDDLKFSLRLSMKIYEKKERLKVYEKNRR